MGTAGRRKKLPVGIEDFEEIRTEGFYYVDKTAMIRELLNRWGKVNLFTRPRRFGKSLNMSMLKYFLIAGERELCQEYMGKFPVIFVSLKGVWADNYETARGLMINVVNKEARRLQYLLESQRLSAKDKESFPKSTMDQKPSF